jgi:hypothetical protein
MFRCPITINIRTLKVCNKVSSNILFKNQVRNNKYQKKDTILHTLKHLQKQNILLKNVSY